MKSHFYLVLVLVLAAAPALALTRGDANTLRIDHDRAARRITVSAHIADVHALPLTIEAGMPAVPVRTVLTALPRGARLTGVQVDEGTRAACDYPVRLNRSNLPYSWHDTDHSDLAPVEAPRVPAQYPPQRVQASLQVLHHVPVVVVNIHPVIANAARGTCELAPDTTVTLTYEEDPEARGVRSITAHEAGQVRALVANPDAVPMGDSTEGGYDYLILSSASLIAFPGPGGFADLVANLGTRGLKAKVVDVATAIAGGQGRDPQAKIRSFIKNEYETSKIRYVLLAADGDASGAGAVIPARRCFAKVNSYDGHWHYIQNAIPADNYYGCLDADWDGNGNGTYGEPTDGANGGDVDLLAEVTVGRMPMKTTAELKNFVTKTISYAGDTRKNALLMGEELFAEMNLYGDDYMNQLVGTCTDHAYETHGYGQDWTIAHLYDREESWYGSTALTKISGGDFSVVHHLGHSNTDYNMRLYSSKLKKFTNAKPFFYYTQGCFPGDFTENDCFIELMVRAEHAAVAAVANTCYGLGPEDPQPNTTTTPGASQMLHRRFVDACQAGAESLGRANQASKEAFLGLASAPEMRWVFWDANYFGDPSLKPPR